MTEMSPQLTPRRSGSNLLSIALAVAGLVAVGGLAFAVGRVTAPATAATATRFGTDAAGSGFSGTGTNGLGGTRGNAFGGFAGAANLIVRGTVAAISADRLTLTVANGTSIEIPLSSSTTYHQQNAATVKDVEVGSSVLVEVGGFARQLGAPGSSAGGSFDPNATPNPSQVPSLGPASDVTVVTP